VLHRFEEKGYDAHLVPVEGGAVRVADSQTEIAADGLIVDEVARLEGTSDPDDMMLVAAVRLPDDGRKGTLVLAYGPIASDADADVLRELPL
jgi:hypothetical protein